MKNFLKLFGIIAFVAIIGFSMTACEREHPLVGRWEYVNDPSSTVEFFSDGNGSWDGMAFTWVAERDQLRLTMTMFGMTATETGTFNISRSVLTLTDEDGDSIYRRVR